MRVIWQVAILATALALGGCSTFNKVTGQTDDTVLPGQREDAVPGRASFPDPSEKVTPGTNVSASEPIPQDASPPAEATPCPAEDPACSGAADGTFSDPQ